jgi:hypothetical protein
MSLIIPAGGCVEIDEAREVAHNRKFAADILKMLFILLPRPYVPEVIPPGQSLVNETIQTHSCLQPPCREFAWTGRLVSCYPQTQMITAATVRNISRSY